MKNIIFSIITSVFFQLTFSQKSLEYSYDNGDVDKLKEYFKSITLAQIKNIEGSYKGQRKKFYEKQLESLNEQLKDSTFIFNEELSSRVQVIFDQIYNANPELKDEKFKFLFDKTMYPNAAAYGNGLFTINLGLFTFFDSEDEVAFVICHELAHYYLLHIKKKIDKLITETNSKQIKEKARKIKRMRYGQNTAGMKLLKDLSFDLSSHSREAELQADAKGLEYFLKTSYNKEAARTALEKLGELEDLIFKHRVNWDNHFSVNNYHFKKHLLEKEETLFDSEDVLDDYEWDKDSLRSHPHTDMRIEKLTQYFSDDAKVKSNENYKEINTLSRKLSISAAIDAKNLDFAMYLIVINLEIDDNEENYYIGKLALVLKRLYQLKKEHRIGKYISLESDFSDEIHLNDIRRFIHNIDLYELKKMGKYYTAFHYDKYKDNFDLIDAYKFFNNN